MLSLPSRFMQHGFAYRQISRVGDIACFEKRWQGVGEPTWEVVVVQKRQACELHGRHVPAHEAMPSSEQWGRLATSHTSRASAFSRMQVIQDRRETQQGEVLRLG